MWQAKCWQMLHIAVTIAVAFPSSVWKKSHRRGTLVNGATLSYCEISNKRKTLLHYLCCTKDLQVRREDPSEGRCAVGLVSSWFIPAQDLVPHSILQLLPGLLSTGTDAFGPSMPQARVLARWTSVDSWVGFPDSVSRYVGMGRPQAAALQWSQVHRRTKQVCTCVSLLYFGPLSQQANCFEAANINVVPVCIAPRYPRSLAAR